MYVTGVRNPYRISFDRANSDMYWGDVGENTYEEVDFLKAGSNASGPPVDYGWPQLEADHHSLISGAPQTTTNPFTGVTSLYPIQEWTHGAAGNAAIGGYVYRGPIPELQGKYFFADYVTGRIWMLDFDRNTDPGHVSRHERRAHRDDRHSGARTSIDRAVGSYVGDTNLATINGLDHIVSFGEDNQGNLYLVDLGYRHDVQTASTRPMPAKYSSWSAARFRRRSTGRNTGLGREVFAGRAASNFSRKRTPRIREPGTNWFDYPGGTNSPVTVPFDAAQSSVFFRLIWPQ